MSIKPEEMPREELNVLCKELFAALAGREAQQLRQAKIIVDLKKQLDEMDSIKSVALYWQTVARDKVAPETYTILERLYNLAAHTPTFNHCDYDETLSSGDY